MIDFVFPENNEAEFIAMAKKLGYSAICFVYSLKDFKRFESKDLKVYSAILTEEKFEKAKQIADFVFAKANGNTRGLIENKRVNFIYGFEESVRRDFIHYRNSGLNQVLCNLMREKNLKYFLSLTHLISSEDPQFFGRAAQNIRFCDKFKVGVNFGSFALDPLEMRAASDVASLLKVLGLKNPKKALEIK